MRDLLAAKLITPVLPEQHEDSLYAPMETFLQFLDREIDQGELQPGGLRGQPASRGGAEPGTVFQIHMGKLGYKVAEGLLERKLASRARTGEWYEVESRAAAQFMVYLATALGANEAMDPITDSAGHLAFAFSSLRDSPAASKRRLEEMRASVLESLLPAPNRPVSVDELADFKEHHGDLLGGFRRRIEDHLVDLALIEDDWARAQKLDNYQEELQQQINEIRARMDERQWPRMVLGTVCGLVAAAIPGVSGAIAGDPVAAGLAAPGLVSAMYLGIPRLQRTKDWMSSPLAYAALAQTKLN